MRQLQCRGPHPEPLGGSIFEKAIQPYGANEAGKTLYDDMRRMEAMVSATDLAWTIVRPSGLFEALLVSAYGVALDYLGNWFTARLDSADRRLRQALTDAYVRSPTAVVTPSAKPSMLKLIWHEAPARPRKPDENVPGTFPSAAIRIDTMNERPDRPRTPAPTTPSSRSCRPPTGAACSTCLFA